MSTPEVDAAATVPPLRGDRQQKKHMEAMQKSYLDAIIAAAGCTMAMLNIDDGIDVLVKHRSTSHALGLDQWLQVQLKASGAIAPGPTGAVSVQFSRERFELFAEPAPTIKKIVVIMAQPPEISDWLSATHENLALRHCCYWVNISGETTSAAHPTVSAPRTQIFDDVALCGIMERIGQGGSP